MVREFSAAMHNALNPTASSLLASSCAGQEQTTYCIFEVALHSL